MRISSGGVVSIANSAPKTWSSNSQAVLQIGNTGALELYDTTDDPFSLLSNLYRGTDNSYKYIENNEAARISFYQGDINFATAPVGTADTNATITSRLFIQNEGNVGIGTTSPSSVLHVSDTTQPKITIEDSTNSSFGRITGGGTTGSLTLEADYTNTKSSTVMAFNVDNSEAMRIDSSGNLLVGTTSTNLAYSSSNTGSAQYADGSHAHSRDGGIAGYYNRLTSDGKILNFTKDGTTVGSIGTSGGTIYIGQDDTTLRFDSGATPSIKPSGTNGATLDATTDLGDASNRWKDLYLSGGVSNPSGSLTFDTTGGEAMRIDSSGNVGIGLTSAGNKLEILGSVVSKALNTDTGFLVGENGSAALLRQYENRPMLFFTNNTERMRIDSSGNLLVGKTTTDIGTQGTRLDNTGRAFFTRSNGFCAQLNRLSSDGDIVEFRKDGTTVGSIGSASGNRIYIGTGNSTLGFSPVVNAVYGYSGDNTVDLGTSATRFKDLYLSGSLSDGTTSRTVADIVGLTSSQFLRSDANDTTTGMLTVDNDSGVKVVWGTETTNVFYTGYGIDSQRGTTYIRPLNDNTQTLYIGNYNDTLDWNTIAMKVGDGDNVTINNNKVFHAGNDGSGSGLDADTVDGIQASSFLRSDASDTMSGQLLINNSSANPLELQRSSQVGIEFNDTSTGSRYLGVNSGNLRYGSNLDHSANSLVWTSGNDGSGSGLDADLLDGQQGSYYLNTSTTFGGDVSGTYNAIVVANDSHTHAFNNLTGKTSGTGEYSTSGYLTAGRGSGGISLTHNDGYGNANITFNHKSGVPEQNGQSGRITLNTDNTVSGNAQMDFELGLGTSGTVINLPPVFSLFADEVKTWQPLTVTGAITATGDITAYFSDERLKDFDGKIEGALDKVSQLNGYYYHENDKAKELGFENDARQVGVSAQEVEAVLPEVIKPAPVDPEYKTVQYEKLVPLLIEAIKELKEEVRQLKEDKA
jgi:hypothetical protein